MANFTGNKYPEELRALRAQYPNTQFDSHGRVIGGIPIAQYTDTPGILIRPKTQASAVAIPASVKTYSQFDPATGTWVRHGNGVAMPLASGNAPDVAASLNRGARRRSSGSRNKSNATPASTDLGYGVTIQPNGTYNYSKTHGNEDPRAPLTQPGIVVVNGENASATTSNTSKTPNGIEFVNGQPVSLDRTQNIPIEYDGDIRTLNNVPASTGVTGQPVVNVDSAEIGQAVPIREATPRLDLNGYIPPTQGKVDLGRLAQGVGASILAPAIIGGSLYYGPTVAGATFGLGRTALASGLGAAAKVLPKNMTSRVSSWANSAIDASKGLFNRFGGFLRRPVTPEEAAAQAQQAAYQQAANIGARVRAGQYYTH